MNHKRRIKPLPSKPESHDFKSILIALENWFADKWFPQEIWEQIIDYIYNDFETLKSLSLVCASFRHAAQLHLFYSVTLIEDKKSRERNRYAVVTPPRHGRLYTCADLSALFQECPHVVRYIKSFILDDKVLASADPMTLALIFAELTHLEEAALLWPPRITSPPEALQPFSRKAFLELFSLSTITSLDLCPNLFENSYELNSLLHQCCNLEHFGWYQNELFDWGRSPWRPRLTPPKLKSLHIHGYDTAAFVPFIQQRVPFNLSTIEELSIGTMHDSVACFSSIRDLFHIIGASLRHLRIDVRTAYWEVPPEDGVFPLDFTETPNIRSLHFFDCSLAPFGHFTSWVSAIPIPPSLRQVTLEVMCDYRTEDGKFTTSVNLIALGEHLAAHEGQLEDVAVITHRKHTRDLCAPPHSCWGYNARKEDDVVDMGDDLLDQVLIRMPDVGGKLRVLERSVCAPGAGRRRKDYDRYLVKHSSSRAGASLL